MQKLKTLLASLFRRWADSLDPPMVAAKEDSGGGGGPGPVR